MKDINDIIEEIEDVIGYDGTEFGDSVQRLLDANSYSYIYSDEFNKAVEAELREMHRFIKEEMELVEEVIPVQERIVRTLRNKNEC